MTTTLQVCYETILTNKIQATFKMPGIKNKALGEVDGRSNTVVAGRLDELHDSTVFTNLLEKVSLAYSFISGTGSLTLPGQFDSKDVSDSDCASISSLLG